MKSFCHSFKFTAENVCTYTQIAFFRSTVGFLFVFVWFGVLFLFFVVFYFVLGGGCYGDIKVILYNVASNMNALVSNGISYL